MRELAPGGPAEAGGIIAVGDELRAVDGERVHPPPPPPSYSVDTPRPSPRTNRTRRVPHPVLIGHGTKRGPRAGARAPAPGPRNPRPRSATRPAARPPRTLAVLAAPADRSPSLLLPLPMSLLYTHPPPLSLLLPLPMSLLYTHSPPSLLLPLPMSLLCTPSVDQQRPLR